MEWVAVTWLIKSMGSEAKDIETVNHPNNVYNFPTGFIQEKLQ